mmetsp:Transcript_12855/g.17564  ORF Transcript_12855/g.17564 Transcript_12855/m.17564 type:complete len:161 (-) Transcript_12855:169-651(-)
MASRAWSRGLCQLASRFKLESSASTFLKSTINFEKSSHRGFASACEKNPVPSNNAEMHFLIGRNVESSTTVHLTPSTLLPLVPGLLGSEVSTLLKEQGFVNLINLGPRVSIAPVLPLGTPTVLNVSSTAQLQASSVKKKRKRKMNRHKHRKRLKRERHKN